MINLPFRKTFPPVLTNHPFLGSLTIAAAILGGLGFLFHDTPVSFSSEFGHQHQ